MADSRIEQAAGSESGKQASAADVARILEGLEGRVQAAVGVIQHLREDRNLLKSELEEAKNIIRDLQSRVEDSGTKGDRSAALQKECDHLMQTQAVTARRIEQIIERLGSLGIE